MRSDAEWQGATWKQEEDHSVETEALLRRINAADMPVLLRSTNRPLEEYVDELMALEKRARLGGDFISSKKLAVECVRIHRTAGTIATTCAVLELLMRKRGQSKDVQSAMVEETALTLGDAERSREGRAEVLEKLRHITDGKIHVEVQFARCTKSLADMYVEDRRLREALDMLAGVHVETITAMPRIEKLTILLLQLQLCIELKDTLQAPIVSRTFSWRALSKRDSKHIRRTYFSLMREYYDREGSTLLVARTWLEEASTFGDDDELTECLIKAAIMCLLAPHTSPKEVADAAECCAFCPETHRPSRTEWLKELQGDKRIEVSAPNLHALIDAFNSKDLARVPAQTHVDVVASHSLFTNCPRRLQDLHRRLSEHDVMVMASYYTRIRIPRLAQLAGLSLEECEAYLLSLVSTKEVYAKVDRVDGVVVFQRSDNTTDVKSRWSEAVERMIGLLDRVAHLVMKERALQAMRSSTAEGGAR